MGNINNQQPVEAGALTDIFKLLFKGLDNLFDSAAEYHNEMGKLKSITKIPVTKDNKEYVVQIKLAPVKNRENVFYVEIEDGGCPGLDFSKYHEKTMRIDRNNKEQFENIINDILKEAGAQRTGTQGGDTSQDVYKEDCYDRDEFNEWSFEGEKGPHPDIIGVSAEIVPVGEGKVNLIVKRSDNKELKFDDHDLVPENVSEIDSNKIEEIMNKIINDSNLVPVSDQESGEETTEDEQPEQQMGESAEDEQGTPAASYVDVSLSYIRSSEEVRLDAIYANYDISDAMKVVEQVVDDDDFVAILTEEPQSFRIVDDGDDFDVSQISRVDTSYMNEDIINAITLLDDLLQNYYINMDAQQQTAAYELTSVLKRSRIPFQTEYITYD